MGLENVMQFSLQLITRILHKNDDLYLSLVFPLLSTSSYLLTSPCVGDGAHGLALVNIAALPLSGPRVLNTHPLPRFLIA